MAQEFNLETVTEGFLHFEDNEVKLLDNDGQELNSVEFESAKEAKQFFDDMVFQIASNEKTAQEFVHYLPEFPPQRLRFEAARSE